LPIVILPYLLYRGYFKAFAATLLFYACSLLLPGFIVGFDYNNYLIQSWFALINPANTNHVLDVDERSFHGLTTLLSTLFIENPPDTYALHIKRNIANVSIGTLSVIIMAVRLILISFTLYFLKFKPFLSSPSALSRFTEIAYLLLLVPLIFPHQQHYAFLFICPAFSLCLFSLIKNYSRFKKSNRIILSILLSIIYLLCNLKLLLGEFDPYYQHFKILTYGALLIIPMLVWVFKNAMVSEENLNARADLL
jgi:hypothetical protein